MTGSNPERHGMEQEIRDGKGRFKPGRSGNPSGRPLSSKSARARLATLAAPGTTLTGAFSRQRLGDLPLVEVAHCAGIGLDIQAGGLDQYQSAGVIDHKQNNRAIRLKIRNSDDVTFAFA